MKINVLGVKRMKGKKKDTGAEYDICNLIAILPVETAANANFEVSGFGYETGEMPLDPAALLQFSQHKFPALLDLTVEPVLYRGKIEQLVTGTTTQPTIAKAV